MNLLYETIKVLAEEGKTLDDIVAIGNHTHSMTVEEFIRLADTEYDDGYGGQEVAEDLYLVGEDFWLDRGEYDGSEWWEFNRMPVIPKDGKKIKYLTVGQVEAATGKDLCGWLTLAEMHEMEER
jgi:hypothetical protein